MNPNLNHLLQEAKAPTLQELYLFKQGQLPEVDMHRIERFFAENEEWADLLDGLDEVSKEEIQTLSTTVNQRISALAGRKTIQFPVKQVLRYAAAVVAITVLGGGIVGVVLQFSGGEDEMSDAVYAPRHDEAMASDFASILTDTFVTDSILGESVEEEADLFIAAPMLADAPKERLKQKEKTKEKDSTAGSEAVAETELDETELDGGNQLVLVEEEPENTTPQPKPATVVVRVLEKASPALADAQSTKQKAGRTQRNRPAFGGEVEGTKNADYNVTLAPQYPGGDAALVKYFLDHFGNSDDGSLLEEKGTAVLQIEVNSKGKVTSGKVVNGISRNVDKQLQQLMDDMPRWQEAPVKGKEGKVVYKVSVKF